MAMKFETLSAEMCPCCGVTTRTYRIHMDPYMTDFLRRLHKHHGLLRPVHLRDMYPAGLKASHDGGYLLHWGLVQRTGKGFYQLTQEGRNFLAGRIGVPAFVDLFDNQVINKSSRKVWIKDAN